jgi:adenosylhomocysteine nucleosidase
MKTGIIGAEKQEVELLFAAIIQSGKPNVVTKRGQLVFHEGELSGTPVVVVCCGIGKVNAALCTQILVSEFHVDRVINTGAAGGLASSLEVLDMVVSTETVQHDFDTTAFGYAPGQVPGQPSAFIPADASLREKAHTAFRKVSANGKMIDGRIASGDAFISDVTRRATIVERFAPACVEMEGAAVAHVCAANAIPFVILRSISDLAGHEAGMSYDEFSKIASHTSAGVVMEMLSLL